MGDWHLTLASDGRRPLFPGEETRRAAVRAIARAAGGELVLSSVVDDHVHLVVSAERTRVGWLARALLLGLRRLAVAAPEPARVRPVETRAHLESLVRYVLGETAHHGLTQHPALWTGSCFPTAEALRAGGVGRLVAAVAAAHAVPAALAGKPADVVTARRAVAQLAHACGLATADLAWALHITPQAARRLRTPPAPDALLRAARARHALVERLAGAALPRESAAPGAP